MPGCVLPASDPPAIARSMVFGIFELSALDRPALVRQVWKTNRGAGAVAAREHPASYKVPRSVSFTDELPKTRSRKGAVASGSSGGQGPSLAHYVRVPGAPPAGRRSSEVGGA